MWKNVLLFHKNKMMSVLCKYWSCCYSIFEGIKYKHPRYHAFERKTKKCHNDGNSYLWKHFTFFVYVDYKRTIVIHFSLLDSFVFDSKPYWISLGVGRYVVLSFQGSIIYYILTTDIRLHFDYIRILWKLIDETAIFQSFLYQKHYGGWRKKSNNGNLCDHITICKVGFPHYIWNVCISSFLQNIT